MLENLDILYNDFGELDVSHNLLLNTLNIKNNSSLSCVKIASGQVVQNVTKDAGQELRDDCN